MTLYNDDGSLSRFLVGPVVVPGILQTVALPEREIIWQVQQGVAGIGGSTIWRGVKLIESVVITTLLATPGKTMAEWNEAVAAWKAFMFQIHPVATAKPPAWDVSYPTFALLHPPLSRMAHKKNSIQPFNANATAHKAILELIEYKPLKLVRAGPPDPAQIDSRDVPPQTAAEAEADALLQHARGL